MESAVLALFVTIHIKTEYYILVALKGVSV